MDLIEHYCFRYKSWKRRWFILNDNCLYYFEFTTDKEPRGIIPLENISVSPLSPLKFFSPFNIFPFCNSFPSIILLCRSEM